MNFFRKKSFESVRAVSASSGLDKTLTAFDLILLGLGAIIGTGVFVLTGMVAAKYSGPAVTISYIIAGATCIFVALAYTELAAMLPTSGSIYTYSYVAFGEVFAWLIGSVMILELNFASASVAAGWSGYVNGLLGKAGFPLPAALTKVPAEGGIVNLPAVVVVLLTATILYFGTKDSKRLNAALVFLKMAAIFSFIILAIPHFDASHLNDFMPFGFDDVVVGASILFFAFTGFGAIATTAEECKNPKRDLMFGIIGSLVLATTAYVIIAVLLTGIAPFSELGNADALAHALSINGSHIGSAIVATGAICGMTTVLMMNLYAQSRIFYVIARDGLLPKSFAKLHPKHDSPYVTLIIFAALAAILAGFGPFQVLAQLSSMGALIDYIAVICIVLLFRFKLPEAARPFKCPAVWIVAPLAIVACVYLLFKQILDKNGGLLLTGELIIYWFIAMFVLYILRNILMGKNKEV